MSAPPFTAHSVPRLDGRVFVVTGANSGIGFEAARVLAGAGARVVMACRSADKAAAAIATIQSETPSASVEFAALDLSSQASVRGCAAALLARLDRIDVLINNAGVMALPLRRTEDGFEMQFGTNHLGHFALTGLLLPRIAATAGARIVVLSSSAHRFGRIHFDDLNWQASYSKWGAYNQSKLANLMFAYELGRRLEARGMEVRAVACHPGYSGTSLQEAGPAMEGSAFGGFIMRLGNRLLSQSAAAGALPTLYAAVAEEARSGDFIGPAGPLHLWGTPTHERSTARSHDGPAAARLWTVSEELTGVRFLD